jgi:hypothetical protein
MPSSRMESPIDAAISCTSPGSKDAPQASGVGKAAAFHAARPVRHSSCTSAGIPSRVSRLSLLCSCHSQAARSAGSTGRVPYTRVYWPSPFLVTSSS